MSLKLYPNFLHDAAQYAQAERFWEELFRGAVATEHVEGDWEYPWLQAHFADGTPFGDGDPIFSARSPNGAIGLRIIQIEPGQSGGVEFESWRDSFDGEAGAVRNLVISCVLDDDTARRAEELIRQWVSPKAREYMTSRNA